MITKACTTGSAFIKFQNNDRLIQDGTCTDYDPGVPVFETDTLTCDNTGGSGSGYCMLIGVETKK